VAWLGRRTRVTTVNEQRVERAATGERQTA
jgi:hypothetical protein